MNTRPYPSPHSSWLMFQKWRDLCFIHWKVNAEILRKKIPDSLELDLYNNEAYLAVVPFWMSHIRPRFFPVVPYLSTFPELNVRTYVKHKGKTGVYFFSLDAHSHLAVWGARTFFHLPYHYSKMSITNNNENFEYHSIRQNKQKSTFKAQYYATEKVVYSKENSLENFLTERYCLFTTQESSLYCCDIDHKPWPLQIGQVNIETNQLPECADFDLSAKPLVHFAKEIDVKIWPLVRI